MPDKREHDKSIEDTEKLFEEICRIETTLKCNFVDDRYGMADILRWGKKKDNLLIKKLIKLYKEYRARIIVFGRD